MVVFSSLESKRKLRVLETWQRIRLWLICSTERKGLSEREQWEILIPSSLPLQKMPHFPSWLMLFSRCLSTWCKEIRALHSWSSAVWDKDNLPPIWPLCMKPLLHYQEKIMFLTLPLQTEKPKCFTPFNTPCSTLILQWISGNNPRVKHLQVDEGKNLIRASLEILRLNLVPKKLSCSSTLQLLMAYPQHKKLQIHSTLQRGLKHLMPALWGGNFKALFNCFLVWGVLHLFKCLLF